MQRKAMKIIQVTLDTNVLDHDIISKIKECAQDLPIQFATATVTTRELEGSSIHPLIEPIFETGVWDESRWDQSVWGGDNENDLFEKLLRLVSNGSFPQPGKRDCLTEGQLHQMRDVMILITHVREKRDIFVTNEKKAFIGKDGMLRKSLESLCSTRIMNADEFCSYCLTYKK